MGVIGFKNQEKLCIFQLMSAILHLGNVQFDLAKYHHGSDGVFITNKMGKPLMYLPDFFHLTFTCQSLLWRRVGLERLTCFIHLDSVSRTRPSLFLRREFHVSIPGAERR